MVVITDIAVPADQFALGQLLDEYPEITIELERLVPLQEGIIPLFWVDGTTPEEIEVTVQEDHFPKRFTTGSTIVWWQSRLISVSSPLLLQRTSSNNRVSEYSA